MTWALYQVRNVHPCVERLLATETTPDRLQPGQVAELSYTAQVEDEVGPSDIFLSRILIDPEVPSFHECREDNNQSEETIAVCIE